MKPHKKSTDVCNECEQELIDEMNRLVGAVENYTRKDSQRKKEEVEEAFAKAKQPVSQQ